MTELYRSTSLARRFGMLAFVLLAFVATDTRQPVSAQSSDPCAPPLGNAIKCENGQIGSLPSEWDIVDAGDPNIQGFATNISVNHGQTVSFKIDSTSAYSLDIYRMGYYGGRGARKVATIPSSQTTFPDQPECQLDEPTGLVDCGNWAVTASWAVPSTAVSGIYFAKANRLVGGSSHIFFIVRDDERHAEMLFQTSDTTWQAYNRYGGNSLYVGAPDGRAYKVSYNRPFTTRKDTPEDWVFNSEYPMVRFLEANGYDVSYATGVDSDRFGSALLNHKIFLSVGHDEYWSGTQRANVEAARAAGVHLGFFSGNEIFWKTRWEPSFSSDHTAYRTLVTYKETHADAKIDPTVGVWTGTWRDPRFASSTDGGRPENGLTGTIFTVNAGTTAVRVPAAEGKLRFWRNTPLATLGAGATATLPDGTLGYEWDSDLDNGFRPAGLIRLSDTTATNVQVLEDYGTNYGPGIANHAATLYRHASGALVFAAGTIQWTWGLDENHDGASAPTSLAMQQAAVNLFADMGVQPVTLASNLVTAAPSTDTIAPSSVIVSPAAGSTVPASTTVTVSGTALDTGGRVGGVEVSTDGGATWHPAVGRETWSYSWRTGAGAAVSLKTRAVDDSGNIGIASAAVPVTVGGGAPSCPCSIWSATQTPINITENDGAAVELGTKFQTDTAGYITAIRFYKSVENVGPFVGNLWTSGGTLLATVPFTSVTGAGWQQAALSSPVPVTANTTYVVSYHTASGYYSGDAGYFNAAGVDNGPLHALRDGADGGNGVYRYGSSGFPSATWGSSNYWVDVIFVTSGVGPDTTPPQATGTSPAAGGLGVPVASAVSASFSEAINPATVTTTTFQLRNSSGTLVPAAVSYLAASFTATLQPSSSLAAATTYTATVRGGSSGVKDTAGNPLAADLVWSFTTGAAPPPPPNDGPGGPILVVASSSNPFSKYYAEILRNEGLNAFLVKDISTVTSTVLNGYDVVILGEMTLTSTQVTMFTSWVTAGGNLIAMRPDKQLASLLGLTSTSGTLADAYMKVDTSVTPGQGIAGDTMQFHGTADRYTLGSATPVASLYSNATTGTSNPAVTLRPVGGNGGQAAAFTYDLAKSVVYTRQGNPAWAGQERDGLSPIRSDDLFFGGSVPDYLDHSKVAIPQADEQQRLLVNLINEMNADRKPLPHFWYLPRGLKAAVVMTGDDHGNNGTAGRFDIYNAASPAGCSLDNWECVRATSYLYPSTPISPAQAAAYVAQGFELGVHTQTGCGDYTPSSIATIYDEQLAEYAATFPTLPPPITNRTHCIAWSDYTSQAETELVHGIRFDTNYYYWPDVWVQDTPGLFTGSGMPMRFAKVDGTLIDVYQAATQMTDESGQSYMLHIDTLLNRALGPEGYYAVVTANMHTDTADHPGSEAILASAQARGVPVISAEQMLRWLDGRNNSAFTNLTWNGNALGFTVTAGSGATGLQALVPASSSAGLVTGITRNGAPVSYTVQTIKGTSYAVFPAAAGGYVVSYAVDNVAPVITNLIVTPASTSATVSWTTNESSTTLVRYGLNPSALAQSASAAGSSTSHVVTLAGLAPATTYYYTVTSVDGSGNAATAPASPGTFTTSGATAPPPMTLTDTTVADFGAGTTASTSVVADGDGAVALTPGLDERFDGASLPAGWSSEAWNSGGAATVGGGTLTIDGARASLDALSAPGATLDFVATFSGAGYQHAGYGVTLNETPWAIFSTGSGGALSARTHDGSSAIDTPIAGNWIGTPHHYRIEWQPAAVVFSIDGTVVATHATSIATGMRPIGSDYDTGGGALVIDSMSQGPYPASGTFTSRILDAGSSVAWTSASWTASVPSGTGLAMSARFGNTAAPDGTWTSFVPLTSSGVTLTQTSRYAQYQATLTSASGGATPTLTDVTFSAPGVSTPVISVGGTSVLEGNAGTTSALLTLTLSAPSTSPVTVNYATANGTATAGSDYVASSGTATFAPGSVVTTIAVSVLGDTALESDETFFVNFSSPVNATLAASQATVTIVNDDLATISIAGATVAEGNSGTKTVTLTLTLSASLNTPVTVNYATADGTATAGSDYVAKSGVVTFPAHTTSALLDFTINGDTVAEPNETFFVNLSSPVGAAVPSPQATVTITNDDAPSITIADLAIAEGNSGTKTATLTLTLSQPVSSAVTVRYATANGTATSGSDYVAKSSTTLTFPAGSTTASATVTINGDTTVEQNETFVVNLSNASGATIGDSQATVTILNDDAPSIRINDLSVTEGNSGQTTATVTLTLSAPTINTVTVNYSTANGTATAGSDYVSKSGTATFAAGTTSTTIAFTVNGDTTAEANETFLVNLSGASNATIGDSQGVVTILNDDVPSVTIADMSITEGNSGTKSVTLTLTLSAPTTSAVSVTYSTANGSATSGSDYVAKSGTATIAAGSSSTTFTVTINGDTTAEADETFFVNLTGATNATIGDAQAQVTIVNDDLPSITIADVAVPEGNSGTKTVTLTLTLSQAVSSAVTVRYATANGTASSSSDYQSKSATTVTFPAGSTTASATVVINGDTTVEQNETVLVNLTSPSGATIADSQAVLTIQNDDAPSLSINNQTITEGNSGTSNMTFTVTLSAPTTSTVTVNYATANNTATAPSDYTSRSGSLTFTPGTTTQTIVVPIVGDRTRESTETFYVNLSGATNATIGTSRGTGTITDND